MAAVGTTDRFNWGCAVPDPVNAAQTGRLTRRGDFLRAAKGKRWHTDAFTVQASIVDLVQTRARIGFTLTRKVGCAVVRNRARRRLKEAVRLSRDLPVEAGRDYVIIGREGALRLPFDRLKQELAQAIRGATKAGRRPAKGAGRPGEIRPERTRPQ